MTYRVLVVGDANVDLVLTGDVVPRFGQAEQLLDAAGLVLGGSASIAAVGLSRLEVPTALVAVVGDDDFGRTTTHALRAAGVDTRWVRTDPAAPTGISVILSAEERAILTLPGTIGFATAAQVREAATEFRPDHVHFASFFLLPSLAVELAELLSWLRERGITVSLDTNWDPAERWAGLAEVLPLVDYLLPNEAECRALAAALSGEVGRTQHDDYDDDDAGAARALAATGATVVVKAGAAGGWSTDGSGPTVQVPGLAVDVVDTTGAGDSFDSGYLAAIAHGVIGEAERLRWATVAGSLSTQAVGGTAAQANLEQLLRAVQSSRSTADPPVTVLD